MNVKPDTKKVVVNDGELELTVRGTNEAFLRQLLLNMGDPEALMSPNRLMNMANADRSAAVHGADNFLNYCLGMGVVNEPPRGLDLSDIVAFMPDAIKDNAHNPKLRRSFWLRFIINDGHGLSLSDQSTLVAEITALTFHTVPHFDGKTPKPNKQKRTKRAKRTKRNYNNQ